MLKRNSIKVHSNTRLHWQLTLETRTGRPYEWFWKCFERFRQKPTIVLNIDWVQFVVKNYEIPHSVRGLYDKLYVLFHLRCDV